MRVIIKRPGTPPFITQIGDNFRDLQRALAEPGEPPCTFESCLRDLLVVVWCDEEYLLKEPKPRLNFRLPGDGHPICGNVVVTSTVDTIDGPSNGSLSDEEVARWMYLLVLLDMSLDGRRGMLDELAELLTPSDLIAGAIVSKQLAALPRDIVIPEPRLTFSAFEEN